MIKKRNNKNGFTLVELIAVIAIIGILSAVLVPKVIGYMNEAKKVEIITQARNVVTAAESYKIKTNKVPELSNLLDQDGLIYGEKIDKLNGANVEICYKIIDTKNYDIKIEGNKFKELINKY